MKGSLARKVLCLLTAGSDGVRRCGIDPRLPLDRAGYVVFDTELTGLKTRQDSIVSLGAIAMTGGRIELGRTFYRLVEPRTALRGSSVVVHGITPTEAQAWPSIGKVLPEFLEFCGDSIVVGHVVSIDLAFLNGELERTLHRGLPNPAVDTLSVHRWLMGRDNDVCAFYGGSAEATDLLSLAKAEGIPVVGAHNALNDAFVTAQLFQRYLSMLPRHGIRTVGELLRIGKP
jgi:DNA polymerase-3 subunit epsilon